MNRMVVSEGALVGGVITASAATAFGTPEGKDIAYNVGGQRTSVTVTSTSYGTYGEPYTSINKELYAYDAAGRLTQIQTSASASATTGTSRSQFAYNLIGQQTSQQDYAANGTTVVFNRTASYNTKGQLSADSSYTVKTDNKTYTTSNTYYLTDKLTAQYLLGAVGWQRSVSSVSGTSGTTTSETVNTYVWYDSALQQKISYDADIFSSSNPVYDTTFTYNGLGQLTSAYIRDGKPHSAIFTNDELGQVIRRDETAVSGQTGSPHEVWYRFGGRQFGYTGNNGTSSLSTPASIGDKQVLAPTNQGTFRNKQIYGSSYTDFATLR